jgi:acyl-CoA synthetase (NDP forming)
MDSERRSAARRANIARLLAPRSIAFVGGSRLTAAIQLVRNAGYEGRLHVVNPSVPEIEGIACVPGIADLPEVPDVAFLVTPIGPTIAAIRELSARGTPAAVCYAAGFAELGEEGRLLQEELVDAAGDMALVGPNCFGIINYVTHASLWTVPYPRPESGSSVAVVAQSGNLCINLSQSQRSVPWRYIVSAGNQAVLGIEDYIHGFLADPEVKVIGVFLEGLRDVPAFHDAALAAAEKCVPIVVLKGGVTPAGARLAMSHTSSLAGTDAFYDALFRRVGVIRCQTIPEFEETLKLVAVWGARPGQRLVAFSSSGGDSGMAADFASQAGLELPQPSPEQVAAVQAELPPYGQVSNPLDFTAVMWGAEEPLCRAFTSLLREHADKAVLVVDHPQQAEGISPSVEAMIRALERASAATGVPAGISSINPESMPPAMRDRLIRAGLAPLQGLHDAMRAIKGTAAYAEWRAAFAGGRRPAALIDTARGDARQARLLDEAEGKAALSRHGLVVPEGRVVTLDDVAAAARELGGRVVVKGLHEQLAHKTEAGAVALGLASPEDAAKAARDMVAHVARHAPAIRLERFLVERMLPRPVAEVLVGVQQDEQFGLTLSIGVGGVLVELIAQAVTLLLPARRDEIADAFRQGALGRLIAGYRGSPPGDLEAAVRAVEAIAGYATAERRRLIELDVNPLMVMPEGQGAVAADVLVRLAQD